MHNAAMLSAETIVYSDRPGWQLKAPLARQGAAIGALLLGCCLGLVPVSGALAQAEVYRCTAPDGSLEFRQHRCDQNDSSNRLQIQDTRTGWTPPAVDDLRTSGERRKQKRKTPAAQDQKADYADRCWNKRQRLERVNAQLRAGYRPDQGVKLRRRRSEYEAYLRRYCR